MKKNLLIVLAIFVLVSTSFASSLAIAKTDASNQTRNETRFLQDLERWDFEEGLDGWETNDATAVEALWHVHEEGGDQGNVFWMGQSNGGYIDEMYLVLDTPEIAISEGNNTLTFDMAIAVEAPGGTGEYNGWDGCNIRISTDDGETWTVLGNDVIEPDYDATSFYSFGNIHGEGPNVPAWGGTHAWGETTVDLSAYNGDDVKIRFAFASDPAYNTGDDNSLFGFKVDNIALGSFSSNGDDLGELVTSSMVPLGGDLWRIATGGYNSDNCIACNEDVENGTYNPNMIDEIISPEVTLPAGASLFASVFAKGNITDPNDGSTDLSELDYWGWEIYADGSWRAMTNITADPNGNNYVFSDVTEDWMNVTEAYDSLDGEITALAGETVKFKLYLKSDEDAPIANGGVYFDDFVVSQDIYVADVENVTLTENEGAVDVAWEEPGQYADHEVSWIEGQATTFVNDGESYAIVVPNEESVESPLLGITYTFGHTASGVNPSETSVVVFADNGGLPGDEIFRKDNCMVGASSTTIDLSDSDIMIAANGKVFVGVEFTTASESGILGSTADQVCKSYAKHNGTWDLVENVYNGLKNLAITATYGVIDTSLPVPDSYKVYHKVGSDEYAELAEVTETNYSHTSPTTGAINDYKVVAMYGVNGSTGVEKSIYIMPANTMVVSHDDNSAEQSYIPASGTIVASVYNATGDVEISCIQFYVNEKTNSNLVWRIAEASNLENFVNQGTVTATNIAQGWNTVILDTPVTVNGSFAVVYVNVNNGQRIGLDTNSNGHLFKKGVSDDGFELDNSGEIMLRAIVNDTAVDNNENDVTAPAFNLSTYPNPFNPETTISFNMPNQGNAKVAIYNIKGQVVNTLVNGNVAAGRNEIVWNGTDSNNQTVASGVYFVKVKTESNNQVRKVVLMK